MIQVSPGVFRGGRPHSIKELKDAGIGVIINLESGAQELFHDDQYEKDMQEAAESGITVYNPKWSDICPPSKEELDYALNLILSAVRKNLLVYIHCLHGKDRTGLLIAYFRVRHHQWKIGQALQEMYGYGFHKWPYMAWVPFFRISCVR